MKIVGTTTNVMHLARKRTGHKARKHGITVVLSIPEEKKHGYAPTDHR